MPQTLDPQTPGLSTFFPQNNTLISWEEQNLLMEHCSDKKMMTAVPQGISFLQDEITGRNWVRTNATPNAISSLLQTASARKAKGFKPFC